MILDEALGAPSSPSPHLFTDSYFNSCPHACMHSPVHSIFLGREDSSLPVWNTEFCFLKLQGMAFYRRPALLA
jgi:hypothetical protein